MTRASGSNRRMAERVFDLFAQAQTGLDRAKGGLGIGLSLAQRLTDLHGGSIRVHSDGLGHGAEFVVTLPLVEPVAQAVTPPAAPAVVAARGVAQPYRSAGRRQRRCDARAVAAADHAGFERRHGARRRRSPGRAPRSSGPTSCCSIWVCRWWTDIGSPRLLRARPGGDALLLVAISGYGQPEDRERSKAVGFDHHLVKPIDCAELVALMRDGVRPRTAEPDLGAATAG